MAVVSEDSIARDLLVPLGGGDVLVSVALRKSGRGSQAAFAFAWALACACPFSASSARPLKVEGRSFGDYFPLLHVDHSFLREVADGVTATRRSIARVALRREPTHAQSDARA